jgi:hypothetical protein
MMTLKIQQWAMDAIVFLPCSIARESWRVEGVGLDQKKISGMLLLQRLPYT